MSQLTKLTTFATENRLISHAYKLFQSRARLKILQNHYSSLADLSIFKFSYAIHENNALSFY